MREALYERLSNFDFTKDQLKDKSLFQLVNLEFLVVGHRNYIGHYFNTWETLQQLFGQSIYDKPCEDPKVEEQTVKREPYKRPSGTVRAHFRTREEAEAFARDPANHPAYLGDIAHECRVCGFWHLSRFEWLFPEWKLRGNASMN